ncbi:hypothetical protein G7054_g10532 [Neopestalotiopsis clavispora]|nr:hypothetical protein G7054_g10532 [Neopestalotiopsis clavispora]
MAMATASTPPSVILTVAILAFIVGPMLWAKHLHLPVSFMSQIVKKRARAWAYLFNGPGIIRQGYHQSRGEPFKIDAPDVRMTFVSSTKHIKELDNAPDTVLSLNGAAKHMLQPCYTMNGFNWFDRRGVEGVGFVRTLRTLLTNNIPQLLPDLGHLSRVRWSEGLSGAKSNNDTPAEVTNIFVLAVGYVEETLLTAEFVKLLPKFLAPVAGGMLGRILHSHKTFFKSLIPATEERIQEEALKKLGHPVKQRADCIQWIIETAPRQSPWSAERVIYELMAIWFGSVHILSTTIVYVLHDLCLHPEYVEPLRLELAASYDEFQRTGKGLPLLDSFIKESARLTPVESMSVRRCALQPFSLSDGTRVEVGEWACAPSGAINTSAEHYPRPDEFSGFRFVDPKHLETVCGTSPAGAVQPKPSSLTDADHSYLMWGTGRMACPGRYYASAFMKVVVAQLLMNYDFTLIEPDAPRWISWRVAKIPRPWTKLAFTPRNTAES